MRRLALARQCAGRVLLYSLALLLVSALLARALVMPSPGQTLVLVRQPRLVVEAVGAERFEPSRAVLEMPLPVRLAEVSQVFIELLLFDEDRGFYHHPGIDWQGMARGLLGLLSGQSRGGSTITQQLIKNVYLNHERSFARKLLEILLAPQLELALDKSQILEAYINQAYFGSGLYGIEAAARGYFQTRAKCLTPLQAAMLVRTLKAPAERNPKRDPERLRQEARALLARYHAGRGELATLATPASSCRRLRSSWPPARRFYARDAMLAEVQQKYRDRVGEDPFMAWSTLDPRLQLYAERAVDEALRERPFYDFEQIALVAMSPDGRIRALVGGDDYGHSPWNRALFARRQPGSAIKPLVYLAALEAGWRMRDMIEDSPRRFGTYAPRNIDERYLGRISLRDALILSRNAATVALAEAIGRWRIQDLARRLDYRGRLPDSPAMALGAGEVTLVDLVALFATLVNGGYPVEPRYVEALRLGGGGFLPLPEPSARTRAVSPRHLCALLEALADVIRRPEGTAHQALARLAGPVIGKTGTSQNYRDAWFVGATPHLVVGIWVGNDDGRPMRKLVGGDLPARVFARFMEHALLEAGALGQFAGCE